MLQNIVDYFLDAGVEVYLILLVLVVLEAVLSADNAIALASIAKSVKDPQAQQKALNIGLVGAYILRIILILGATYVIEYWQFELLGALYLLWLVFNYFVLADDEEEEPETRTLGFKSLWQVIPTIAITDLAFSLDSVTSAIAITEDTWLIIAGGTMGIVILRFLAGLFIRWLQEYVYLEDAGFITVGFVGLRLLLKVWLPDYLIPEWVTIAVVAIFFTWGFSKKVPLEADNSES